MKRSELVQRLALRFPALQTRDAQSAVDLICEAIGRFLMEGRRIEIRGFGSFAANYRGARLNRNPKTGDRLQVPPKYVPHFRTGKELRQALVEQSARREASRLQAGLNPPSDPGRG